ncbi:MAG: hypothetical protein Q8934_08955 [Bacillota bacterium]|nr:hypothetical protein [Bacillota bacterium]
MKKAIPVILSLSLLGAVTPSFVSNNKVEAATTVNTSAFNDPNLYQYASTDTFKVTNGTLYLTDSNGKFFKPSESLVSNKTLVSVANSLLDKQRYLSVFYNNDGDFPDSINFVVAANPVAAKVGLKPITYTYYLKNKYKLPSYKNTYAKASMFLDYTWYDAVKDKNYSDVFKEDLYHCLVAQYGTSQGYQIFNYILANHIKYRTQIPNENQVIRMSKKIGSETVYLTMLDSGLYVDFS